MSGSGGGGFGGGGGGFGGGGGGGGGDEITPNTCASIFKLKALTSPNAAIIAQLKKGDSLVVYSTGSALQIRTEAGEMCGTVISDIGDVLACIDLNFEYAAVVHEVSAGKCTVVIRPK